VQFTIPERKSFQTRLLCIRIWIY